MQQVSLDQALRLLDLATVAGKIDLIVALCQALQRADVSTHAAFRWCNDARVPAHDVVAGEEDFSAPQRKTQMVGCMSRRVHGGDRPTVTIEAPSVGQGKVGNEVLFHVLAARRAGALRAAIGDAPAKAHGFGAGGGEQRRHAVGVVAMGMGDDDVADPAPARGIKDGSQVRRLVGTRVDEADRPTVADQVGVGTLEGKVVGIVGDDADHSRCQLAWLAVSEDHRFLEGQFVRHGDPSVALLPDLMMGFSPMRCKRLPRRRRCDGLRLAGDRVCAPVTAQPPRRLALNRAASVFALLGFDVVDLVG